MMQVIKFRNEFARGQQKLCKGGTIEMDGRELEQLTRCLELSTEYPIDEPDLII